MSTCDVYKNGIKLAHGSITNGATQITGLTEENASAALALGVGKNVQVVITSSTDIGRVWQAKVTAYVAATTLDVKGIGMQGGNGNPYAT